MLILHARETQAARKAAQAAKAAAAAAALAAAQEAENKARSAPPSKSKKQPKQPKKQQPKAPEVSTHLKTYENAGFQDYEIGFRSYKIFNITEKMVNVGTAKQLVFDVMEA